MYRNQRMVARDGHEVVLFPLEYMNISQGELMPSGWSHYNTYNMDFLGWDENGRVYQCPLYAPCTLKLVSLWDYNGSHTTTWESVNKVHIANGTLNYITIGFTHADNPPYHTIGDIVDQGDLIYYTGTYGNVTGDHVHMTCGIGRFSDYEQRIGGHWDLANRSHIYDTLFINNTILIDDHDYNWKYWDEPPIPSTQKKSKFPWVLYARKLRNRYEYRRNY